MNSAGAIFKFRIYLAHNFKLFYSQNTSDSDSIFPKNKGIFPNCCIFTTFFPW